jgi:hypothetical protein
MRGLELSIAHLIGHPDQDSESAGHIAESVFSPAARSHPQKQNDPELSHWVA